MSKCEQIFLDAEGNKTSVEKAVEVITRTYNDEGKLISRTIESVCQNDTSAFQGHYGEDIHAAASQPVVNNDLTDTTSWICPNDETVNSGNVCLICGISREEACVSHNDEASVVIEQFNANNNDDESSDEPKKKTKIWLWIAAVVTCLCIALLFDRIASATQNTAKDTIAAENNTESTSNAADVGSKNLSVVDFHRILPQIAAGDQFVVGITENGECIASGSYLPDLSSWHDVAQVYANGFTVVGVTKTGKVLSSDSSLQVQSWEKIVMADYESDFDGNQHVVALRSDGTAVACGTNNYGECDVSSWSSIVKVAAGARHSVGLTDKGTVVAVGFGDDGQLDVSEWSDIVDIAAAKTATYALRKDGTILVAGYYKDQYVDRVDPVPQWDNVIAIIAGNEKGMDHDYVIGICRDGTIVSNRYGYTSPEEIASFANVASLASSSWGYTVAICTDGTVQEIGWDVDGSRNASEWKQMSVGYMDHDHVWLEATYDAPQTCQICGITIGNSKGYVGELAYSFTDQSFDTAAAGGGNGRAGVIELSNPIDNCKRLRYNLSISNLTDGNVFGEWGFYVHQTNGKWRLVDTFTVSSQAESKDYIFDEPMSFDAYACHCHCLGNSWSFNFNFWLDNVQVVVD